MKLAKEIELRRTSPAATHSLKPPAIQGGGTRPNPTTTHQENKPRITRIFANELGSLGSTISILFTEAPHNSVHHFNVNRSYLVFGRA